MSDQQLQRLEADERFESAIIRAARDESIDIAKLQALLDMQRRVEQDRSIRMFNTAMADAQAEMLPVARDAMNTHTKSRYARLATIDAQMRPIYTHHGFSVRYGSQPCPREGWSRITITVAHSGGHWEENYLDAPPDSEGQKGTANKTAIQGIGSSVSYLRRYLLCMAFNIVLSDDIDPDDDGNSGRDGTRQRLDPLNDTPRDPVTRPPADPLEEANGTLWLRNLTALLKAAPTLDALVTIGGHRRVREAKSKAPLLIRRTIDDLFREAHERLAPVGGDGADDRGGDDANAPGQTWDDPIEGLLGEVEAMDAITLAALPTNAVWRGKTRELFPPDQDRIAEAIEARKLKLKGSTSQ